jgi:hypothetical protein
MPHMNTNEKLTLAMQTDLSTLHEIGRTIRADALDASQIAQLLSRLRTVNARVQELHNRSLGFTPPPFGDGRNYFGRRPYAVG